VSSHNLTKAKAKALHMTEERGGRARPGVHRAEAAATCAGVAHDHNGGGCGVVLASAPALANVRALGFLCVHECDNLFFGTGDRQALRGGAQTWQTVASLRPLSCSLSS